jgi:ribonuclease D
MINKTEISTAIAAADTPVMVETADHLNDAIEVWQQCELIGIDTEFVRERTYRADLGLIQVSDGKTVWLVDPLKTGPLHRFSSLFENTSVNKILHAPSEDLEVLLYTTGTCPDPLFDTQIACAMLGESLQMGYHKTVEWLLDIIIDKGETRSNWLKRPLRDAQLHYAALDVCLLPMMQRELSDRLRELDRLHWLEEDCRRLTRKARVPTDPEKSWMRINGNNRLDGGSLAVLQKLAKWREYEADRRNLARGFVVKDVVLLKIARAQPANNTELSGLDVLHPRMVERNGKAIISMVRQVLQSESSLDALPTLDTAQRKLMAGMRGVVSDKAEELSVEPALLASKRELESLIFTAEGDELPERFLGWRKSIITDELVALKDKYA